VTEFEPEQGYTDAPRPWWMVTTGPGPDGSTYVAPFWKRVHLRNLRWRFHIWQLGKRGY
jgi:hypothetical protein